MYKILVKFEDSEHTCEYQSEICLPIGLRILMKTRYGEGMCQVTDNKECADVIDTTKNIMTRWITEYGISSNGKCTDLSKELRQGIIENYRKWQQLNLHHLDEEDKRIKSGCTYEIDCCCAYCDTDY
ncbi:hypothetical protein ACUWUW_004413 [Vibrio vulnificus]